MGTILIMKQKELQRAHALAMVFEDIITLKRASEIMGVSYRQAKRLKSKFGKEGIKGLAHGNRGKNSSRCLSKEISEKILNLSQEKYFNFNDTHFTEHLIEKEGITVSRETVRQIRRRNRIKPKRKRRAKNHYKRRERKEQEGIMVLWDGSPHKWFGEDKPACCLMSAVDDATGKILSAFFIDFEGSFGYLKLLKSIVEREGIPLCIYQDRHSSLKRSDNHWSLEEQLANKQEPTQVGLALEGLSITAIFALSAQAKGRIESLFRVLQDRLIAELGLHKIKTMEDGNRFLENIFIKDYNKRFRKIATQEQKAWRKTPNSSEIDRIISFKYKAVVGNDNTVRIDGKILDIPKGKGNRGYAKAKVDVCQLLDGTWEVYYKNELLLKDESTVSQVPIRALCRKRSKLKDNFIYVSSKSV